MTGTTPATARASLSREHEARDEVRGAVDGVVSGVAVVLGHPGVSPSTVVSSSGTWRSRMATIRTRDTPWPQGPWDKPAVLRERPDAEQIECQAVVSGRWKPLSDPYWNDCVIPVRWGFVAAQNGRSTDV